MTTAELWMWFSLASLFGFSIGMHVERWRERRLRKKIRADMEKTAAETVRLVDFLCALDAVDKKDRAPQLSIVGRKKR